MGNDAVCQHINLGKVPTNLARTLKIRQQTSFKKTQPRGYASVSSQGVPKQKPRQVTARTPVLASLLFTSKKLRFSGLCCTNRNEGHGFTARVSKARHNWAKKLPRGPQKILEFLKTILPSKPLSLQNHSAFKTSQLAGTKNMQTWPKKKPSKQVGGAPVCFGRGSRNKKFAKMAEMGTKHCHAQHAWPCYSYHKLKEVSNYIIRPKKSKKGMSMTPLEHEVAIPRLSTWKKNSMYISIYIYIFFFATSAALRRVERFKKAEATGLKNRSHMAVNNWHHLQQNATDGVVCNGDGQKTS